jgi:hypothetical protein
MDEWSKVLSDKLRRRSCHCPSKKKIRSKMKWKYSEIDQITKSRERERGALRCGQQGAKPIAGTK